MTTIVSTKTNRILRMNTDLIKEFDEIASAMGLSFTGAMTLLAKKFVLEKKIEVTLPTASWEAFSENETKEILNLPHVTSFLETARHAR